MRARGAQQQCTRDGKSAKTPDEWHVGEPPSVTALPAESRAWRTSLRENHARNLVVLLLSAAVYGAAHSPDFGHQRTPQYTRQLDLIEVAAGLRPVVEFLLELERTVTDGVKDRRDHLQMRSRILHLP